jgi:hypothetical protein
MTLTDAYSTWMTGATRLGTYMDYDGISAPSVSAAGTARTYYDSAANKLKISENSGAYVNVV